MILNYVIRIVKLTNNILFEKKLTLDKLNIITLSKILFNFLHGIFQTLL